MKTPFWIPLLFVLAAVYDGILGVLFLAAPGYPFKYFDVKPPNHLGYVQFPAALLLIFALMFLVIALDPVRRRGLIWFGVLLKIAYCAVSGWHWLTAGIPDMWKPFTIIDLAMLVLFLWAYTILRGRAETASGQHAP
jgi:hypothetical protein